MSGCDAIDEMSWAQTTVQSTADQQLSKSKSKSPIFTQVKAKVGLLSKKLLE